MSIKRCAKKDLFDLVSGKKKIGGQMDKKKKESVFQAEGRMYTKKLCR